MAKTLLYIYIRTFYPDRFWNAWFMRATRAFIAFWLHEFARKYHSNRFKFYIWTLIDNHPKLSQAVFEMPSDRPSQTNDPCRLSMT